VVDAVVLRRDDNESRRSGVRGDVAVSAISDQPCLPVNLWVRYGSRPGKTWKGYLNLVVGRNAVDVELTYGIYMIYLCRWTVSPTSFVIVVCIHE